MFYIIGLGNPGEKYEATRHNIGRIVLEQLAAAEHFPEWSKSSGANALYSKGELADELVELLLPETFMNNSGQSVRYVCGKHDPDPAQIIVIYDDVDLPLGELRVALGKGAGGHNGVQSIINALGTKDFIRLRLGISPTSFWTGKLKRPTGEQMSRYVLGRFTGGEMKKVTEVGGSALVALKTILTDGIEKAMNQCN